MTSDLTQITLGKQLCTEEERVKRNNEMAFETQDCFPQSALAD